LKKKDLNDNQESKYWKKYEVFFFNLLYDYLLNFFQLKFLILDTLKIKPFVSNLICNLLRKWEKFHCVFWRKKSNICLNTDKKKIYIYLNLSHLHYIFLINSKIQVYAPMKATIKRTFDNFHSDITSAILRKDGKLI